MEARIGIEQLQEHAAALQRLARRLAHDGSDAEDLVQDTWLRAVEKPPRSSQSLRGWLRAVLINRHREVNRAAALRREHEQRAQREEGEVEDASDDLEERLRLQSALARALLELPEPNRAAVTLRYIDGLSGAEVARLQGISHDALRQRLARGLALLRERLDRELGSRRAWALAVLARPDPHPFPAAPLLAATAMSTTTKIAAASVALALALATILILIRSEPLEPSPVRVTSPTASELEHSTAAVPALAKEARAAIPLDSGSDVDLGAAGIDREHDLFGIVVDPTGAPIAGASVRVTRNESSGWTMHDVAEFERFVSLAASTTHADGRFVFPLERGRPLDLFVEAAGFAPAHLAQRNAGEHVVVRMEPAGSLDVSVVQSDGTPLTEGRVDVTSAPEGAPDERWTIRTVPLDAHGHALVEGLPCRTLNVQAVPAGSSWPTWEDATITAGAVTKLVITLPEGDEVRGRVLDAHTKRGIVGARVGPPRWFGRGVMTDADGAFVIPLMSRAFGLLQVHTTGYADASVDVRAERESPVPPVTIELLPGRLVRGRVIDTAGSPVAGAYVAGFGHAWHDRWMQADWIGARSDAQGRFELADLDPSLAHTLVAHKDGLGAAMFDLPAYENESERIEIGDIVLHAPAWIAGRVLDVQAKPLGGARVVITGTNSDRSVLPGARAPDVDSMPADRHVLTDDLGRFAFADLAPGEYTLRAETENQQVLSDVLSLHLSSDERRTGLELHYLTVLSIKGRVLTHDGRPIVCPIRIVPVGPHERSFGAVSEADGSFAAETLPAGVYDLVFVPDEGAPATLRVPAGTLDVDMHLPENDPVRGRLRDAQGQPVARAWVQLIDPSCDQTLSFCESRDDGSFELALARGAHARLMAVSRKRADDTKPRAEIADVASGSDLDVRLVLPP